MHVAASDNRVPVPASRALAADRSGDPQLPGSRRVRRADSRGAGREDPQGGDVQPKGLIPRVEGH